MRFWFLCMAMILSGCGDVDPPSSRPPLSEETAKGHPVASCGYCADAAGKNDVKHLCAASAAAWDAMVKCICADSCAGPCGADWCARLSDVAYTNASDACEACVEAACWPELIVCGGAT